MLRAELALGLARADHEPAHVVARGEDAGERLEQERDALEGQEAPDVGDHPLAAEAEALGEGFVAGPGREAGGVHAVGDEKDAVLGDAARQDVAAEAVADDDHRVDGAGEARLQRAHGGVARRAVPAVPRPLDGVLPEGADLVDAGHAEATRGGVRGQAAEDGGVRVDHIDGGSDGRGSAAPARPSPAAGDGTPRRRSRAAGAGVRWCTTPVDPLGRGRALLADGGEGDRLEPERGLARQDGRGARRVAGGAGERAIEDVQDPHAECDVRAPPFAESGAQASPVFSVGRGSEGSTMAASSSVLVASSASA